MAHPRQKTEAVLFAFAVLVLLLAATIYIVSHKGPPPVGTAKPPASAKQPKAQTASPPPPGKPLPRSGRDPFGSPFAGSRPTPSSGSLPPPGPRPPSLPPPAGAPQLQEFVLAGVLTGPSPLAMVRRGEKRYLVRVGQALEGGYSVRAIEEDRVVLSKGGERLVLRLGEARVPATAPERKGG